MKDSKGFSGLIARAAGSKIFAFAVIGAVAGLLLLILPSGSGSETVQSNAAAPDAEEYCASLEAKAEALINELEGVKSCKVVITLAEGYRYVYATDQHVDETESGGGKAKKTDKTVVLAEVSGAKAPLPLTETPPAVAGVAVVCRGADYQLKYRIIELMCALFDVKSNRISVQS